MVFKEEPTVVWYDVTDPAFVVAAQAQVDQIRVANPPTLTDLVVEPGFPQ